MGMDRTIILSASPAAIGLLLSVISTTSQASYASDVWSSPSAPAPPPPPPLARILRPDASSWSRTKCGDPGGGADIPSRWASDVNPAERETPLELYPRPQMVRCGASGVGIGCSRGCEDGGVADAERLRDVGDESTWQNLNGLWEWEEAKNGDKVDDWRKEADTPPPPPDPPFGRTLDGSILVPFPVESCLSGVAPTRSADLVRSMWYRMQFDPLQTGAASERTLLHFGAVDWATHVYLNGHLLGNHAGGYDGFSFDITSLLKPQGEGEGEREGEGSAVNELLVYAFDPSDGGAQPSGKQRASAIDSCRGDTYTPSSGVWQTVWLERVPDTYVGELKIDQASTEAVDVTVGLNGTVVNDVTARVEVLDGSAVVASAVGSPGEIVTLPVPNAKLWSPSRPFLYDLRVTLLHGRRNTARRGGGDAGVFDTVISYFGLRTFEAATSGRQVAGDGALRPTLNGRPIFLAGVLDQSFWPDGLYAAPTDDALAFDVGLVPGLGMNLIRLHQKVNPERWYYHADRLGVVVFQDMPQKLGGASSALVPLFVRDMTAAIEGKRNHPCIVQWTVFNEGDSWEVFTEKPYDLPGMVELARALDPSRLVDTDSGGKANDLHVGDVNDVHTYPFPGDPRPSGTQYAMVGEYGGLGVFVEGKEWKPGGCFAYRQCRSSEEYALLYAGMASLLEGRSDHIGAVVYTQTTDLECECDGLVNYDRSAKFSDEEAALIKRANERLTRPPDVDGDVAWSMMAREN